MIHRSIEVHVENKWHAASFAEAAIGKTYAVSFDKLCRRGLMGIGVVSNSWSTIETFIDNLDSRSAAIGEWFDARGEDWSHPRRGTKFLGIADPSH